MKRTIASALSRASHRSARGSLSMHGDARPFDRRAQERVADRARHREIDWPVEQGGERIPQTKEVGERDGTVVRFELDQKVDIRARGEIVAARRGAEQIQPPHAELPAQGGDIGTMRGDGGNHGVLAFGYSDREPGRLRGQTHTTTYSRVTMVR